MSSKLKEYVKISVKLTPDVNKRLEDIAERIAHGNKSELMRKMISLMDIYEREHRRNGSDLALVKGDKIEARLIM